MEEIPKGVFPFFVAWTIDIYTSLLMKPERFILLASCPQRDGVKEILHYSIRQGRRGRLHVNSTCSLISGSQF